MLDWRKIEADVQQFWKAKKVVESVTDFNKNYAKRGKKFYLLDGPPYVNGIPHVGHVKTMVFKDIWAKFMFMRGFASWFQPGFDCGGLPIENKVEEKLKIKSKKDIEKIGVDKFIEECKKFAEGNESVWMNFYKKIGVWKGWLEPYMTHKNYYLEAGWWTVKQLYEKGMLVEGYKPGFWCPHCETVLSGYEVTDSYKDIEDPSIYVKFPVLGKKNEYLLVWTTTPWTLPANVAIVAHPDEIYVKIKVEKETWILAKKLVEEVMNKVGKKYKIIEEIKGSELEGIKYKPVIEAKVQKKLENNDKAHRVILSVPILKTKIVSKTYLKKKVEEGGTFGHMVSMDTGTGLVHTAPGHGEVDNKLGRYYNLPEPSPVDEHGCFTEDVEKWKGMFVKDADKEIIKYLKDKGFLVKAEKIVHAYPLCWRCKSPLLYRMSKQWFLKIDIIKSKMLKENKKVNWLPEFARQRFENLLTDSPDWAITRQRYWGIPIPIWECKCGNRKVIGSIKELKENAVSDIDDNIDLHKHEVDKIKLKCPECGDEMNRIPDIMDVWFDSGISPWASLGYPFRNKELFEILWPVDLVDESQDQIRGWFYALMFLSTAVFNKKPYETVCLNGWTLDEKGEKMSKSLGNVIFAEDAYKELGADLLRFYFCVDLAPWDLEKFSIKKAKEYNKFFTILLNIYNFINTYGKENEKIKTIEKIEDRWILSKLNRLIKNTTENIKNFNLHYAGRDLIKFVIEDFSRTYIKLIRNRMDENTCAIVRHILERVLKLMAPIAPFITEYVYQAMNKKKSIHLEQWPEEDKNLIDQKIENKVDGVLDIITAMNAQRREVGIKLRWPLQKVSIEYENLEGTEEIIKSLGNVKEVIFEKVKKPSKTITIKNKKANIFLDTKITDDLKKECLYREVQRLVQLMRKRNKLVVSNKINLYLSEELKPVIKKFEQTLKENVQAKNIIYTNIKEKNLKFENKAFGVKIEKI